MHIFYSPDISKAIHTLSNEESKHCIKVLRLKKGDNVQIINGKGSIYLCEIIDANHKKCLLKIVEKRSKDKRAEYSVHIAIAPTKNNDRFETFLEKATEIGIDEISPFIGRFSERKKINTNRFEKVIISAVKQSANPFLPNMNSLNTFHDLINTKFEGEKYIAHCYESSNKKHLKNSYNKGEDVMILIGPEGDFSEDEIKQAISKGFNEISLSDNRLRTETAGIIACQIIDFMNI